MIDAINIGIPNLTQPTFRPTQFSGLKSWYDASQGIYSDSAIQFTLADNSGLKMATVYDPGVSDFSISFWMYADTVGLSQYIFATGAGANGVDGLAIYLHSSNRIAFVINDSVQGTLTTGYVTSASSIAVSTWYHIVITCDRDGNATGYINGSADLTVDISGHQATLGSTLTTGHFGNYNLASLPYNGRLDSFCIYNKILSEQEISWLYNSGAGRVYQDTSLLTAPTTILTSLVSWWDFNESEGNRYDSHGTNHLTEVFGDIINTTTLNGGFETAGAGGADVFASWSESVSGTSTVNDETVITQSGSHALRLDIDASNNAALVAQTCMTLNKSYRLLFYARGGTGTPTTQVGPSGNYTTFTLTTSYAQYSATFIATNTTLIITRGAATSNSLYFDTLTLTATNILSAAGIARSVASDQNFCLESGNTSTESNILSVADNSTISVQSTDSFTFAGWINIKSYKLSGGNNLGVFNKGSAEYRLLVVAASGNLYGQVGGGTAMQSDSSIPLADWTFIVWEYNSSTGNQTFLINNSTTKTASTAAAPSDGTNSLFVAQFFDKTSSMDASGFWKRLLTTAEKTWLFNSARGRKYRDIGISGNDGSDLKTSLVSWWDFEESFGNRNDSHGTNHLSVAGTFNQGQGVNYLSGVVSRWECCAVAGNYYSQSTASKRPGWRKYSVNNRPGIFFDGTDDVMSQIGGLDTFNNASGGTIIVVKKNVTSPTTFEALLEYSTNSGSATRIGLMAGSTSGKHGFGGRRLDADVYASVSSTTSVDTSNFVIQTGVVDWANSNIYQYINGTLDGSSTSFQTDGNTPADNSSSVYLGGLISSPGDNAVAELIVYNRVLTNSELNQIHKYLGRKYNLSVGLI